MLASSIVLRLALLQYVQGSRLGQPRDVDAETFGTHTWDDKQKPSGHWASSKHSQHSHRSNDDSGHAWADEDNSHELPVDSSVDEMPAPGSMTATMAKRALQHANDQESATRQKAASKHTFSKVMSGYHSDSEVYDSTVHMGSDSNKNYYNAPLDIQDTLDKDADGSLTVAEFMPKCLKHTKTLIADLDYNYGDAQLETILRNWCKSAEEFPHARGSRKVIGFRNHQSCTNFADDLANARYYELSHRSDKGYKLFCTAFYAHHGGFAAPAPPPPPKKPPVYSSSSFAGLSIVVASLLLCLA